ncbi:type I restriction-modification system subunit M [Rhodococcus antarcticus]|uniref:site-specific DNA-methyltransferase (adenine-specific) n=1 Tax=Rhodococcus antarcticus TaxID=2987751 RepID=A0ABY6P037_9NOCA|nr:class I SAM-dependent DNA methyltransferase [Rhodococcus antarcticus]UZJ24518.1 type I restriction-modification system subunit M [Rhodococcus antarcticus]
MSSLGNFVWGIADQLRGVYKPHQYGSIILPMTILRRLDAVMEPSRDTMRDLAGKYDNPNLLASRVRKECGLSFHNTSEFDLARIVADPDSVASNLVDYISRFSPNIDVFERFKFEAEIATLAEKSRLLLVVRQFAEVDLHPDTVSNAEMGDLFEELIRKFAEASNEEAGEHFTPRDAIRLIVDLLFAEDDKALETGAIVRTVYDPTAGTGGMLSVAEERLLEMNPQARLVMFGQEINDQSYAICKSDMIAKGQDATNIRLGDTLADDMFAGKTFDYCMSNPPYGVDWKASTEAITAERAATGVHGRFAPGLPKIGDGQMLFLTHLAHKMRPVHEGGGRAGIVLNGSPLFNGGAESGESEIRRYLLENDLVDAIVALPTNMFYNTGISTYIWILDNAKRPTRVGKVQLIDGSGFFTKMRKNLGDKSREVTEADRKRIAEFYRDFDDQKREAAEHSRVFFTTDFGYWTVTVERPLRLNFEVSPERIEVAVALAEEAKGPLATTDAARLRGVLEDLGTETGAKRYVDRAVFLGVLKACLKNAGLVLGAPASKALWLALSERDETAEICLDAKGKAEPDTSLRDTENIPFGWAPPGKTGNSRHGEDHRDEVIKAYYDYEVKPHVPDTWIDHAKTKTGYEVPFHRHFYKYVPPRPLEEIDTDLDVLVKEILVLLQEVEA